MPMCLTQHMSMHVVSESTEAIPVLQWHSLNSMSMLDLTQLSVCLLPLTRGAPVCAPTTITQCRQRADQDKWMCNQGSNEKALLRWGQAREREGVRWKGKRGRKGGGSMGDLMKSNSETFHDVDIEGKSGARCWTHVSKVSKEKVLQWLWPWIPNKPSTQDRWS